MYAVPFSFSDRQQVESFLDAQGWSHSYCEYSEEPSMLGFYGREAGLRAEQLGGVVFATVPNPNVGIGGLDEGTITVLFFLDRGGRLVRSYIRVWILSL